MRNHAHLQKLYVNLAEKNPLFEGALTLKDARAGTRAIKVDVAARSLTPYEFASDWYIQNTVLVGRSGEFVSVTTALVVDLTDGRTVVVDELGIHHDDESSSLDGFSISARQHDIAALRKWMAANGWSVTEAENLKKLFQDYIEPNEALAAWFSYS
jgi:hypothetical protein